MRLPIPKGVTKMLQFVHSDLWHIGSYGGYTSIGTGGNNPYHAYMFFVCLPNSSVNFTELPWNTLVQRVDSINSILDEPISYQGHHWNPVTSTSYEGTIYEVPMSKFPESACPYPNVEMGGRNVYRPVPMVPGDESFCILDKFVLNSRQTQYRCRFTWMVPRGGYLNCFWYFTFETQTIRVEDWGHGEYFASAYGANLGTVIDIPMYAINAVAWEIGSKGLQYAEYRILTPPYPVQVSVSNISDYNFWKLTMIRWARRWFDDTLSREKTIRWTVLPDFRKFTYAGSSSLNLSKPNLVESFNPLDTQGLVNWKELAGEAYSTMAYSDINGVANLKELFEMGAMCRKYADTLKSIPSKKVKAVASAYLGIHYGFKLTIMDIQELYSTLRKYSRKRSSLSKIQSATSFTYGRWDCVARYQVFYDEFAGVSDILQQLLILSDAYLTFDNVWDMIPYSFVIDWFVDIGSRISELENWATMSQRHEVICAGQSIKATANLTPKDFGPVGYSYTTIRASKYVRSYKNRLIMPSLIPSVTVNPFDHLIEEAALIISRI